MRIESYADIIRSTSPEELSQADPKVRERIFKLFHREQHILAKWSLAESEVGSDTKKIYLKHHYMRKLIASGAKVPRALFLKRLTETEKQAVEYLLFTVLSGKEANDSRVWRVVDSLLAVGSTTWPEEEWEKLQSFSDEYGDEELQQKTARRGGDIDLFLCVDRGVDLRELLSHVKELLELYEIDFVFHEQERIDGKSYVSSPESESEEKRLYKVPHRSYEQPNFIITIDGSREIHLGVHGKKGEEIREREWYEGRSHAVLFDRADLKEEFQELLRGEREEQLNLTVEEKLEQLQNRKKELWKTKLQQHRSYREHRQDGKKEIPF